MTEYWYLDGPAMALVAVIAACYVLGGLVVGTIVGAFLAVLVALGVIIVLLRRIADRQPG